MDMLHMLYSLLHSKHQRLYVIADSIYEVPQWTDIIEAAQYWFSEIHLILGKPWHLTLAKLNAFDSVSIRITQRHDTIFTATPSQYKITHCSLVTKTNIIDQNRGKDFYKELPTTVGVTKVFPFQFSEPLIDDDLKVYSNVKSRIGDL